MENIDLTTTKNTMKSYYLIKKIYEIHNKMIDNEDNPIEYKLISTNFKLLDYIREINFVFVSDVGIIDEIKEYKKVGNLLNLQVFLDPNLKEDKIIFHTENRDKEYELFVNF